MMHQLTELFDAKHRQYIIALRFLNIRGRRVYQSATCLPTGWFVGESSKTLLKTFVRCLMIVRLIQLI